MVQRFSIGNSKNVESAARLWVRYFEQVGQITQTIKELQKLCLSCGLCCNGVLFADVKLQPEDRAKILLKLGIPVRSAGAREKFEQPCVALSSCTCKIY